MTDDRTFQLILIAGLAVVMPIGIYHRLRARTSGEKLDRIGSSVIRHPSCVAFALSVAANSLTIANWFIGVTSAMAFVLIVLRTSKEEENLVKRFGDDYRTYMQKTSRFVPRWNSLRR